MSETHIHLHIPAGYKLVIITASGDRLSLSPIDNVRDNARELANDPTVAAAAEKAVAANVRGNGVTVRVPAAFTKHLERAGERMRAEITKALKSGRWPARAKKKRAKRTKPRVRD